MELKIDEPHRMEGTVSSARFLQELELSLVLTNLGRVRNVW